MKFRNKDKHMPLLGPNSEKFYLFKSACKYLLNSNLKNLWCLRIIILGLLALAPSILTIKTVSNTKIQWAH